MGSLCYSVELLSSLSIRNNVTSQYTVDAGSFFGFGPLFFGAVESAQSFSPFPVAVNISLLPEEVIVEIVESVGEVSLFEPGKGQSFPLYDLESECPHCGFTRGVWLSWSWMLCDRYSRVGVLFELFEKGAMALAAGLLLPSVTEN